MKLIVYLHGMDGFVNIPADRIEKDRTENGDYYKKPTQYWFVNCKPEQNMIFEPLEHVERRRIESEKTTEGINRVVRRSMIHPQYARRFIRSFIYNPDD